MPETVRRGFVSEDEREFHGEALRVLKEAQGDVAYLLNRGYGVSQSVTFVGNRFGLSARQRTALARATSAEDELRSRKNRELKSGLDGKTLTIDGFNLIITLEAALSDTTVLYCMDGALRDLCGLRGTYRLIDKTDTALRLIAEELEALCIGSVVFVLDAPVSNSGRLKQRIWEIMAGRSFKAEITLADHADGLVSGGEFAVTSDSIILNRCGLWINLARLILADSLPEFRPVDLSRGLC